MEYFLISKGEPDAHLLIGTDNGFGVFWGDQGLTALMNVVANSPEKLTELQIKTDKNQSMDISQFLENIEKLKIRT